MKIRTALAAAALVATTIALPAATASADEGVIVERPLPSTSLYDPHVTTAMLDLAKRESVHLSDVSVVSYNVVWWPNTAYGCPQPGFVYPQVMRQGRELILAVDGQEFSYKGGTRGGFAQCSA